MKPAPSLQTPLRAQPIVTEAWRSVSMDFVLDLPADKPKRTGVLVFVDRSSKIMHFAPFSAQSYGRDDSEDRYWSYNHTMACQNPLSRTVTRVLLRLFSRIVPTIGARFLISTAAHSQTDVQTKRVDRVIEDGVRRYATSFTSWSSFILPGRFSINDAFISQQGWRNFLEQIETPRVSALLDHSALEQPVSHIGGWVPADGIAPKIWWFILLSQSW